MSHQKSFSKEGIFLATYLDRDGLEYYHNKIKKYIDESHPDLSMYISGGEQKVTSNEPGATNTFVFNRANGQTVEFTVRNGVIGPTGPQGLQGPTGAASTVAGPQGPTGAQGKQGPTGAQGKQGPTGAASTVAGPTGAQGKQGPTGAIGPTGPTGKGFSVSKTYNSIVAMSADVSNVPEGAFVLISSDVDDEDNAKLYVKNATGFTFLTDLSGAQGIKGETGAQGPTGAPSTVAGPTGAQGKQGPTGATAAVKSYYCTCATAAATAAKVVTCEDTTFKLEPGVVIGVRYTNSNNTATGVTLNVNGTGAKSIYFNNAIYTSNSTSVTGLKDRIIYYMYDGTNWCWISTSGNINTDISLRIYKDEEGSFPLIGSRTAAASITSGSTDVKGEIAQAKAITMTPSSGTITATTFNGTATKVSNSLTVGNATYDGSTAVTVAVIETTDIDTLFEEENTPV